MALDKFRDPADPLWEQRVNGIEEGTQLGAGSITEAKLASEAVTGAKTAPATLGLRQVGSWAFSFPEKTASTKLYVPSTTAAAPITASEATKGVVNFAENAVSAFRFSTAAAASGGYGIAGRTGKMVLEVTWFTNAVEPGIEFTFGFSKIESVAGAEKKVEVKVAAQSAEPTALVATPAASTTAVKTGSTGVLATGQYVPSILLTAGTETAAKSQFAAVMQLFVDYS